MREYVRDLGEICGLERPMVGGKAANLGELTRAGIPVSPGYGVTTRAFDRMVSAIDPAGSIRREIGRLGPDDHDAIARVAADIRGWIRAAPVPDGARAAIGECYRALGDDVPVAVRSSATEEDGADASFAGLQDTYLWVRGLDAVLHHVRMCWASLYNDRSVSYRRSRGIPEGDLAMGVVIQRMVDPRCSGVMFTRSPTTGDRSVIAVEACWGLGSALVSGDVTPDSYVVNKVTGEIIKRVVSAKLHRHCQGPTGSGVRVEAVPEDLRDRPCLGDNELRALVRVARRIEDHYGLPQDIEWAIARDLPRGEDIVLLQSRPETAWASRAAKPLAAPKPRAFDHVLDSLSGLSGHRGAAG